MATSAIVTRGVFHRFNPTASQSRFLHSPAKGRLFGSGAGSGKSKTGCRESIRWAHIYPGSRNGIFRLTAEQLRKTTMVTFWREMRTIGFVEGTHYEHLKADKTINWDNGSVHLYGHLEDEEGLGSLELSSAFVDEGSEVPSARIAYLYSTRLRHHLPGCDLGELVNRMLEGGASDSEVAAVDCACKPSRRMWICTNPGVNDYLEMVVEGQVPGWEFIKAAPGDNPYNGAEYYENMKRLRKVNGEAWYQRFYNGEWGAFEGMRFPMFDRARHVMLHPYKRDSRHLIVEGWDFGHRETFVSWLAYNPAGGEPVVVFDELQMQEVDEPSQVADAVKEVRRRWKISGKEVIALGDPAGIAATQFSSVSPIAAYGALGLNIAPCKAGKSPIDRANLLTEFLAGEHRMYGGEVWPGIVFSPACVATVKSVMAMRWKPAVSKLGEDPREQFVKKGDHGFDALTYGLVQVPAPALPRSRPPRDPSLGIRGQDALREWAGLS